MFLLRQARTFFNQWFSTVCKQSTVPDVDLSDVIILDTGSSLGATFMNPDFLTNIHVSRKPEVMSTNAGEKPLTLKGDLYGFGSAWFDPDNVADIIGFSHFVKQYRVRYDSEREDAFIVDDGDKTFKFSRTESGLYAYRPPASFFERVAKRKRMSPPPSSLSFVSTVTENREGFTKVELKAAKAACDLHGRLGHPSEVAYKAFLRQNMLKNCPVTVEHVRNAEEIFGTDIGPPTGRVTYDEVEIPRCLIKPHRKIVFCVDLMHVNGLIFLTGIDLTVRHRSVVPLKNKTTRELGLKPSSNTGVVDFQSATSIATRSFEQRLTSTETL